MSDETPRIHVDSDWKEEAQREKERLAEESSKAQERGPLPDPSFAEVINMIVMQADLPRRIRDADDVRQARRPALEVRIVSKGHIAGYRHFAFRRQLHGRSRGTQLQPGPV